jgi:hypothetical protein
VDLKPGTRLVSTVCATNVIVVKSSDNDLDIRCGGHPMLAAADAGDGPSAAGPEPGFDGGSLTGKRYVDADDQIELLCTVAGAGALSLGDDALVIKDSKPLPASD